MTKESKLENIFFIILFILILGLCTTVIYYSITSIINTPNISTDDDSTIEDYQDIK